MPEADALQVQPRMTKRERDTSKLEGENLETIHAADQ
jgi:hypothetical protein